MPFQVMHVAEKPSVAKQLGTSLYYHPIIKSNQDLTKSLFFSPSPSPPFKPSNTPFQSIISFLLSSSNPLKKLLTSAPAAPILDVTTLLLGAP